MTNSELYDKVKHLMGRAWWPTFVQEYGADVVIMYAHGCWNFKTKFGQCLWAMPPSIAERVVCDILAERAAKHDAGAVRKRQQDAEEWDEWDVFFGLSNGRFIGASYPSRLDALIAAVEEVDSE